jgi:hypothetical protein
MKRWSFKIVPRCGVKYIVVEAEDFHEAVKKASKAADHDELFYANPKREMLLHLPLKARRSAFRFPWDFKKKMGKYDDEGMRI